MKKILIIYPHNFLEHSSGINTRYYQLALYFKSRGIQIDFFGVENFFEDKKWDRDKILAKNMLNELYVYDFKNNKTREQVVAEHKENLRKKTLTYRIKHRISRRLKKIFVPLINSKPSKPEFPKINVLEELPNYAFEGMQDELKHITEKTKYDFVLIGYVYWADLINESNLKNTLKIVDVNDFCTLQHFYHNYGNIKIGALLEEEIKRINLFDVALCISDDERWFFSQFANKPSYYFIPQFFKKQPITFTHNFRFDILFIGSDNIHNQVSIKWFFERVYPLLTNKYTICIIGKITDYVGEYPDLTKIKFVNNLTEIYNQVKISICPMLQGSGMKIKVVEALSYGKPVVCTNKGVDGFNQKRNNGCSVTDEPVEFAGFIDKLIADTKFYHHQRELAISFFQNHLEQSVVGKELDKVFSVEEVDNHTLI